MGGYDELLIWGTYFAALVTAIFSAMKAQFVVNDHLWLTASGK